MSTRAEAQDELRQTLMNLGLNESYGIIDGKDKTANGRSFRTMTFARAGSLDGVVHIFGPKFIVVKWVTAIRRLPHRGMEYFRSVESCQEWLIENFGVTK